MIAQSVVDLYGKDAYKQFLSERRAEIVSRITEAARRAGRSASDVELLAVSKTVDVDGVACALEAGYTAFGENRPQELKRKVQALPDVRFDMIGNLQTNKINQVLGAATLIHSVSSRHLAEAISRRSVAHSKQVRCLIEVNVSGEESKAGFSPREVREAATWLMGLEGIAIEGLMCMAPALDLDEARRSFSGLRELSQVLRSDTGLALNVLSCGMSGDFEIAVEEGSTLVRLGRVVFDPRFEL